jgi:hypothetical protein
MVPIRTVPSPYLNDAPCVEAIIDLLPKIDRGSVVKAGRGWSLALRPCVTLVARQASRLLYFLFDVATPEVVALIVLAIVVPPIPGASSGVQLIYVVSPWRSDLEGKFHRVARARAGLDTAAFVSGGCVGVLPAAHRGIHPRW